MARKEHVNPLLGAHLSISKGLEDIFRQAEILDCTAVQLFTKSNQQWHARDLSAEQIALFKKTHAHYNHMPVVAHASYLLNIGSPDPELATKSKDALVIELERCTALGIPFLVLHPGAHKNTDLEACLQRIATNLSVALKAVPGDCMILLETTAGQGSTVGKTFEELGTILKLTNYNERIGICLDTCHVFVAGYDFTTPKGYAHLWHSFNTHLGKHTLKVIHMNDSVKGCGSYVDRHCDIGKGKIGLEAFRFIMQDHTLNHIPKILETPKSSLEDDARNLAVLRSLIA